MFLSPLSGQRQTREQEEKETGKRGKDLVHLTIYLGLGLIGVSLLSLIHDMHIKPHQ